MTAVRPPEPVEDPGAAGASSVDWWRSAVIYQVYVRSFADSTGDGIGDVPGIRSRIPYLRDLGVDALWINPWYPSPLADGGYDVADYRDIDPRLGDLEQAETLIEEAHAAGIRIILDIVPNHTSDRHRWFQAALQAGPGSPERERYHFRPGRGPDGSEPPTNWRSAFGGSAWTRTTDPDGTPGEWYLHLFAPEQPDLNWDHPAVRQEFEETLRFWFDRGVDGFRIDVAHALAKHPEFPDVEGAARGHGLGIGEPGEHPHWDRDAVHEIYRSWRHIADSYDQPRVFVAEVWLDQAARVARYLREGELHTAFNFDFLRAPWRAGPLREVIDESLSTAASVGAPATWVLSNHDVMRHVSRYGRPQAEEPGHSRSHFDAMDCDVELGRRRAAAAALLMFALPGGAYVYQGEELGLWEVEDLPEEALQDPTWERSGHTDRGRDGCRVPIPWSADGAALGFSPPGSDAPWLPQPAGFADVAVDRQIDDPDSMLSLYRRALHIRREEPALGAGGLTWLDSPPGVLAFARDPGFVCVANLSDAPVALPAHREILLASAPLSASGTLPVDAAVWLRV